MIARHCIAAAGLLALAACGSSGSKSGGNGAASATSAPSGGGAPVAAVSLQPGEWEMTMEIGGMPAEVAAAMKARPSRTCLTKEDLSRPNGQMFSGKSSGQGCTQKEFSMVGGRLHSASICTVPGGSQTTTFVMDGQYSPQSFEATMTLTGAGGGHTGKMTTHMAGRRVGDCPAGKEG